MNRPYRKFHYSALRQLFEDSKYDRKVLQDLFNELQYRKAPKAVTLREQVQESLQETPKGASPQADLFDGYGFSTPRKDQSKDVRQSSGALTSQPDRRQSVVDTEPAFSHNFHLVEPIGTAVGHPSKRVFPLKENVTLDLPADAPINQRYAAALRLLIAEMKRKRSGLRTIQLENGRALPIEGREKGYQFEYEDTPDLFEGATITARIGATETTGRIVTVMQGSIVISLDDDYGEKINVCVLFVDNTAMLEALLKRLESLTEGEGVCFNSALALATVTNKSSQTEPFSALIGMLSTGLNEQQQAAVKMALTNQVSYIWGPPGTGKTQTLASLITALFEQEKRLLICSNTNQAVDQVLLKLCEALGTSHPAVNDGRIIRIGRIAHEKLEKDWSPYVTVSSVVERKSIAVRERLQALEIQVIPMRDGLEKIECLLSLLDQIDSAREEERLLASQAKLAQEKVKQADQTLGLLERKRQSLDDELVKLRGAGVLRRVFMRSENAICRDHQNLIQQKGETEAQVASASQESSDARVAHQKTLNRIQELEQRIPSSTGTRKQLARKKAELEDKIQPLLSEIAVINKKLTDMEAAVVQEARIIGATVTKTYLSPTQFVGFDVVLVDEASMVILPALYYVAGLAGERVVISGDFRQLPPIVQTEQRELVETIGSDVFQAAGIPEAVENGRTPPRLVMLDTQYRMQKPICDLISSAMYGGRLKTRRSPVDSGRRPPPPFDQTLTVVDTSRIWPFVNRDAFGSRYNLMHALAIRNLCLHLHEQGYVRGTGDVGVATPYAAQAKLLQRILTGHDLEDMVAAGTVHRYQGDEKRFMVLDIPDSLGEPRVGIFLEADNPQDRGASLFNVGISRAQDHLVVFANLTYLQDKLPDRALLRDILHAMQSCGQIVDVRDVLALRPVLDDLRTLSRHVELELDTAKAGLFRQKDFEVVCQADIDNARESVAIFSGFVTPQRVAAYGDLFRRKLVEGVAIRCVTRPPIANGSIPTDQGKQALDALEGLGCVVDTRWSIHEKVVIVDERIIWLGSLNMLSHTARTDEMMMRIDNPAVAQQVAIFMTLERSSSAESGKGLSVRRENPACPACGSRTCYRKGRHGPYWSCEECNWTNSMDQAKRIAKVSLDGGNFEQNEGNNVPSCPQYRMPMLRRNGRLGAFYGCSNYPNCRGTLPLDRQGKP